MPQQGASVPMVIIREIPFGERIFRGRRGGSVEGTEISARGCTTLDQDTILRTESGLTRLRIVARMGP